MATVHQNVTQNTNGSVDIQLPAAQAAKGTELDGIRAKVFMDRYALKNERGEAMESYPEQMWARVARAIASVERTDEQRRLWEQKFYEVLSDFKFVPGGRILSGAGTGAHVTFYNCFVIPSPEDSRGGIIDNLKIMTEIMARAGGVGINLSTLRPKGSYIKTVNGTASGPCSWAELYSVATGDVIQQGGSRRGALMLMLNDDHPDIEEFITVKRNLTRINHANLSICVSDPFMDAVKNDRPWNLVWNGEVKKTVQARYLWNLICESAWASGEPGLVFIDRYNKESNTWYYENIICVNPSLRRGTKVLTKDGILPIESLEGREFQVKNLNGQWSPAKCFLSGREKPLYRITLANGKDVYATPEHKWPVRLVGGGFAKVTTDKLQSGHVLPYAAVNDGDFGDDMRLSRDEGFMVGWLYGDGWFGTRSEKGEPFCGFTFSESEKYLAEPVLRLVNSLKPGASTLRSGGDGTHSIQITSKEFSAILQERYGVDVKSKGLPTAVWTAGRSFREGFIDGLLSSDGHVISTSTFIQEVVLVTKHRRMAEDVADLLSFYGLKTSVHQRRIKNAKFPNGKRYDKEYESFQVKLASHNARNFATVFALSHVGKQERLNRIATHAFTRGQNEAGTIPIRAVELTDLREDVWDISVYDDTHCFQIAHCVTGNCGEQGLPEWGVCNLGAINLSAFVSGGAGDQPGVLDYPALADQTRVAMRFLDNVVDATEYFFPENAEAQLGTRRTGLGTMGLADALIKMHVPYGSEESLPIVEQIYQVIRDAAYDCASDLAAEKEPFPRFDREKYLQGKFIQRLPEALQEKIGKQGIRNAVLLTQAPTGTTSLLAGVSSGIEPVYDFAMVRRDRTGEHVLYHPLLQEWKDARPERDSDEAPDWFISANDLSPESHVYVQATVQRYTDSSISKTCNAPNDHTVDQVKTLYTQAYDWGCKGITYFRDGCREGVLSHIEQPKKSAVAEARPVEAVEAIAAVSVIATAVSAEPVLRALPVLPPMSAGSEVRPEAVQLGLGIGTAPEPGHHLKPRPRAAEGITYRMPTPLGTMFTTVTRNGGGQPFEVFLQVGKAGSDTAAVTEALGRLISLVLRLPSPLSPAERLQEVVEQLSGIGGGRQLGFGRNRVRSLPDAISQVLSEFLGGMEVANSAAHAEFVAPPAAMPVPAAHVAVAAGPGAGGAVVSDDGSRRRMKADLCPECGDAALVYEEGCQKCYSCGYSEC